MTVSQSAVLDRERVRVSGVTGYLRRGSMKNKTLDMELVNVVIPFSLLGPPDQSL